MNFTKRLFLNIKTHVRGASHRQFTWSGPLFIKSGLAMVGSAALFSLAPEMKLLSRHSIAFAAPAHGSAKEIEPSLELANSLENYLVVDVAEPQERVDANLIPTCVNIPLKRVLDDSVPIPKDKPILMVCPGGARSMTAADALLARGYSEVYNLKNGTQAWINAGLPVEKLHLKEVNPTKDTEDHLKAYHVVDVREPEERIETGFVPGSINLPLKTVLDGSASVPVGKPLLLVCKSGRRSLKAAENLLSRGYDATNLAGGTMGWIAEGRAVERETV